MYASCLYLQKKHSLYLSGEIMSSLLQRPMILVYKFLVKLFDHFLFINPGLSDIDLIKDTTKILNNGLPTGKALVFKKLIIKHKYKKNYRTLYVIQFLFPYNRHRLLISGYIRIIQYQ